MTAQETPEDGAQQNLERIRKILMGEEKRLNEQRFQSLQQEIASHVQGLRADILDRMGELADRAEGAERELAQHTSQLEEQRRSVLEELGTLRQAFETRCDELASQLEAQVSGVREAKVDRRHLAELLTSMAKSLDA